MGKPEVTVDGALVRIAGIYTMVLQNSDMAEAHRDIFIKTIDAAYEAGKRDAATPAPHPAGEPYFYDTSAGVIQGPDRDGYVFAPALGDATERRLNRAFQLGYDKAKKEGRC
jgi:hypothetical protein